jgi:hypothetical protein
MKKYDAARPARGGQLMLGSVANHAWSEDSLYIKLAKGGDVIVERESKHTTGGTFKVTGLRNKLWTPHVTDDRLDYEDESQDAQFEPSANGNGHRNGNSTKPSKAILALQELGPGQHKTKIIAEQMGVTMGGARRQLQRLLGQGTIQRQGDIWVMAGNK